MATREEHVVHFEPGDPSNPRNFPEWRKWAIVAAITVPDLSVSWGASGYSPATQKFTEDFGVGSEVGTLGLSLYVLGLAFGPMTIAPLSEQFGRTPMYLIPYGMFLFFLLGTALVKSLAGFLILRILSGYFASVTIANLGGTIADLWPRDKVGPAMSLYLWAAVAGSPVGFFFLSFVAQYRGWRDVFWALLGICGGLWLLMAVALLAFSNETRHSVLLRRRAARLNKQHSTEIYTVPEEMQDKTISQLFRVMLTRPFRFLALEAIVQFAASYNGFLYGLSFLFNGAFNLVFGKEGYGFNVLGVGLSFLGLIIGISIGPIVNLWQERHYQRAIRSAGRTSPNDDHEALAGAETGEREGETFKNLPEARLQLAKLAAVLLPISLLMFAWTSPPQYHIHWIVPILATALFGYSFYTLILMSYLYVEDSYMVFSASALAGIGLVRNLFGAGFPLFGSQMFTTLGYNWAGTVLAAVAVLLMPIPFILERYGPRIRAKSPFARQHMDMDKDEEQDRRLDSESSISRE